ncbi:GGDEF domain protein [Minicystis rosea]|nr:GGDEF domain protein [Minicystis rosea]
MPEAPGYAVESALLALFEALDEAVLVFDEHGLCRAAGRRVAEMFGVDASSLVGLARVAVLDRLAAGVAEPDTIAPLVGTSDRTVVDPIAIVRPHERTVVWTSIPSAGGGRVDVLRDVTRERRAEARVDDLVRRLSQESTLDDLTGLANRRRFEEASGGEHRRAQREWVSYAVALVDVDDMRRINETHGRDAGDELLRRVAEELRASRREYDMVARWKDDELVLLLPRADAASLSKVLHRAIEGVHEKGAAIAPGMSVSVGAAVWSPPSAEGPADVIRRAEAALARAREKGTGNVEIDTAAGEWRSDMEDG